MPACSFVGSRTSLDDLLILSAIKAEKPRLEKIAAGLSPFLLILFQVECIDADTVLIYALEAVDPFAVNFFFALFRGVFAGDTYYEQ